MPVMPLWTNVLSPMTLTTLRASSSARPCRSPSPAPMLAPMQTQQSIALNGGSTPSV